MARNKSGRPERKMKPVFLVLCEGETEECYVEHLRQKYRLPIKIISKIVGQQINQKLINRHKKELKISNSENINCFLMYDADVKSVVSNILSCDAKPLLSRPCIEVWFLAHSEKIFSKDISSENCVKRLTSLSDWKSYKKGKLSDTQKTILWEKRLHAGENISNSISDNTTYSTMNDFIATLENFC